GHWPEESKLEGFRANRDHAAFPPAAADADPQLLTKARRRDQHGISTSGGTPDSVLGSLPATPEPGAGGGGPGRPGCRGAAASGTSRDRESEEQPEQEEPREHHDHLTEGPPAHLTSLPARRKDTPAPRG